MHIYRIYNSLTLDEYKYNPEETAFIYGGKHADKVVDKVGDLQFYYGENIDNSEWINPNIIKSILLKITAMKDVDLEMSTDILDLIKNNELILKLPQLNGYGYKCYESNYIESQIVEIDICNAENKSVKYYQDNKEYKWLSKRSKEDMNIIKDIMSNKSIL